MKKIIYFILLCSLFSCSSKLIPGDYVYKNRGQISIDKNLNYKYSNFNHFYNAFSSGKIVIHKDTVIFLPDSAFIFRITDIKLLESSVIKGYKKFILKPDSANRTPLNEFLFYYRTSDLKIIYFDSSGVCNIPDSIPIPAISIYAKLNFGGSFVPSPINDSIETNIIYTSDFDEWNTVELTIHIDNKMFFFRKMDNLLFKRGKLEAIDYPSYKLKVN